MRINRTEPQSSGMGVSPVRPRGIVPLEDGHESPAKPRRVARHKPGLTLVEVTVALAIVSAILAATMGVTVSLARSETRQQGVQEGTLLAVPLRELLTADLGQADAFAPSSTGCILQTRCCLDANTLEQQHLPCTVEYAVQQFADRSWLVRIQRPRLAGSESRQLVCSGLAAFSVEAAQGLATIPADGNLFPAPAAMTVTIQFDQPLRAPLQWTIRQD